MQVTLPYGEGKVSFELPPNCSVRVFSRPASELGSEAEGDKVEAALDYPYGEGLDRVVSGLLARYRNKAAGHRSVDFPSFERDLDIPRSERLIPDSSSVSTAIVISDPTRAVPNTDMLGPLLERLERLGVKREDITVLIGCGKHRGPRPEEIERLIVPSFMRGIKVVAHQAGKSETVYLGTTSRGTPVRFNRLYVEADIRIITGMIEPHQLAGYSGGAKAVFIGLGDEATIAHNHSLLTSPMARAGVFKGNPVREDMEEGFALAKADFMVNVVLDAEKRILRAFAGTYPEAYLEGIRFARETSCVGFEEPCDMVLVSCGGHPKDINMYQAQKALAHVEELVKPGGIVILLARCPDGVGDDKFLAWMRDAPSPEVVIERFRREGFILGAHKAFLLARSLIRARTFLVSELDPTLVQELLLVPFGDPEDAVREALRLLGAKGVTSPLVGVVPQGIGIIPIKESRA